MGFEKDDLMDIFRSSYGLNKRFQHYYEQDSFKNIEYLIDFFISILVNNEVVRDQNQEDCYENYQGSSPDEVCLVQFSHMLNMSFMNKNKKSIQLNILDRKLEYRFIEILEFDSRRKRMSVIVKDMQTK